MKKQILAAALVFGALGCASMTARESTPPQPALDLILRCIGPLAAAEHRPMRIPDECHLLSWTNLPNSLRPPEGWDRSRPLPPGAARTGRLSGADARGGPHPFLDDHPPMPLPPTPFPWARWPFVCGTAL